MGWDRWREPALSLDRIGCRTYAYRGYLHKERTWRPFPGYREPGDWRLAGRIYCVDAGMGVLYWKHDTGHEIWGNPLVADGKVYVNTKQSFWIFAAGRKKEVLFTSRGGSETAPIAANGTVYAFIRGQLYAIGERT